MMNNRIYRPCRATKSSKTAAVMDIKQRSSSEHIDIDNIVEQIARAANAKGLDSLQLLASRLECRDREVGTLQSQLEDKDKIIKALTTSQTQKDAELSVLKQMMQDKNKELSEQYHRMEEVSQVQRALVTEYETQMATLKEQISKYKKKSKNEDSNNPKHHSHKHECSCSHLTCTVQTLESSLKSTQLENKVYRQRLESLESQAKLRKDELRQLQEENLMRKQQDNSEVGSLRQSVSRLESQLNSARNKTNERDNRLLTGLKETENALSSALKEVDRLKRKERVMEDQIGMLKSELDGKRVFNATTAAVAGDSALPSPSSLVSGPCSVDTDIQLQNFEETSSVVQQFINSEQRHAENLDHKIATHIRQLEEQLRSLQSTFDHS